jgi:hypothetical protein
MHCKAMAQIKKGLKPELLKKFLVFKPSKTLEPV